MMFGLFGKKKERRHPVILDLSVKEKPDGWDDASLNGRPVTVVYYETRDGGGSVRTYPGDSRRLACVDARPRAFMIGARLHGGNAYVEP